MGSSPEFELDERHEGGRVCLILRGELDLATAPRLAGRLRQLQVENRAVRVNLAEVAFIDSAGLHVLLDAADHARRTGWPLEVQRDLSPQVRRLFRLTGVEDFILTGHRAVAASC